MSSAFDAMPAAHRCPTCGSPQPSVHPAVGGGGEVTAASTDAFHAPPPRYPTAACTSCRADIIWATTARGKAMPIDVRPDATGNVRLDDRGTGRAPLAVVVQPGQADAFGSDERRWTSHFATCPQADAHRRERR